MFCFASFLTAKSISVTIYIYYICVYKVFVFVFVFYVIILHWFKHSVCMHVIMYDY